jgi:non-homologous end joining protein Ku
MAEYIIKHSSKLRGFENLNFQLDLVKITKAARNESYPNLSNCCSAVLSQRKFCSNCSAEVEDLKALKNKQYKLGKEHYTVPAAHLEEIKKQLDGNQIVIEGYRDVNEVDPLYFTEVVFSSKQHKKSKREYNEYLELLKLTGKVGVGTMTYNSRPYPIMVYQYQDHIVVRALHYENEIDPQPAIEGTPISQQKVELLSKLLKLNQPTDVFDIGVFKNTREEKEQELVELVIEGKELPKVEAVELKAVDETDEIARLEALLKATA